MFEISLKQMKNCIDGLDSTEKELRQIIARMESVYTTFDSLVDGKLDKQMIQAVMDDVLNEAAGVASMKKVLGEIVQQYEQTERRIISGEIQRKREEIFGYVDLRDVSKTLETLGVFFE